MIDPALSVAPKESKADLFAEWINDKVGTIWFFIFCVVLVAVPVILPQTLSVLQYISSSVLQLLLLPLIMIGQNQQDTRNAKRAQKDLETDLEAKKKVEESEVQNDHILAELAEIRKLLENK